MSKPASTLQNKGSYYLKADDLKLVQDTLETLDNPNVSTLSELVVYLCKTRSTPDVNQVDTLSKNLEEKEGKLAELQQSNHILQEENTAYKEQIAEIEKSVKAAIAPVIGDNVGNEDIEEVIGKLFEKMATLLDNFRNAAEKDKALSPLELIDRANEFFTSTFNLCAAGMLSPEEIENKTEVSKQELFERFYETLKYTFERFKYEDEKDKEVPPLELVDRAFRLFHSSENTYRATIEGLKHKLNDQQPFRLGQDEVVIKFEPNVLEAARKCRKYLKQDKKITTDNPSELANLCIYQYLNIFYSNILAH